MGRLDNKVALVTGANSGIGRAIATRFAAEGAHVAVNYLPGGTRDADAQAELATFGTTGIAVPGDVSKRPDVQSMIDATVARFGRLDIVVSNAGIEIKTPFWEIPDEQFNKILGVNLFGAFFVSQIAARQYLKQIDENKNPGLTSNGKIIFVSSIHEDVPFPGHAAYCTTKGGVRMLMRNIALELAPYKINANNIAPGAVDTPINKTTLDDPQAYKNAVSEIPLGRFGHADEVANVALFLASNESDYVAGSTYYIDGAMTQQVTLY